jgi:hypothetical protein
VKQSVAQTEAWALAQLHNRISVSHEVEEGLSRTVNNLSGFQLFRVIEGINACNVYRDKAQKARGLIGLIVFQGEKQ